MSELCWFGVWFSVRDQSSLRMVVRNGVSLLLFKRKTVCHGYLLGLWDSFCKKTDLYLAYAKSRV